MHENRNIRSENISPNYATRGLFLLNLTKTSKADRQTDGRHLQRTGMPERMGKWDMHWSLVFLGDISTPASMRQQAESCHRRGQKTVPAQAAEITKRHVISVVFFF